MGHPMFKSKRKKQDYQETIDSLAELRDTVEEMQDDINKRLETIEKVNSLKDEISDLKKQLLKKNEFIEQLLMKAIDNKLAEQRKPSAVEAYLAKKDGSGSAQSVKEHNKGRLP